MENWSSTSSRRSRGWTSRSHRFRCASIAPRVCGCRALQATSSVHDSAIVVTHLERWARLRLAEMGFLILASVVAVTVALAAAAIVVLRRSTSAVGRELRTHLEREGWGSIRRIPFVIGDSGFRGTWQGRKAEARYHERRKQTAPDIQIDVATLQVERLRISRAYPAGRLAFLTFEFGLPPKVKLADRRFDARGSAELIALILGNEATASQLDIFFRSPMDRIDSKRGTLRIARSLRDKRTPGLSLQLRPPAGEIELSVSLAHRLLKSLISQGF